MDEIIKLANMLPFIHNFRELQIHTAMTDESIILKLAEDVYFLADLFLVNQILLGYHEIQICTKNYDK